MRAARPRRASCCARSPRPQPGYLTFFTNYQSRKGAELAANPRAAAVSCTGTRCAGRCASRAASRRPRRPRATPTSPRAPGRAASAPGPAPEQPDRTRAPSWSRRRRPRRGASARPRRCRATRRAADPGRRDSATAALGRLPPVGRGAWSCGSKATARLHDRARWERTLAADRRGLFGAALASDTAASLSALTGVEGATPARAPLRRAQRAACSTPLVASTLVVASPLGALPDR